MHRSKTCLIMCLADSLLNMQLVNAWVSIAIVRQRFKCQLPIELFYDGESEMPPSFKNLFQVHPEISCHKPPAMLLKWRIPLQNIAHYPPSTSVLVGSMAGDGRLCLPW